MEDKIISEKLLSEIVGQNVTSVYYHKKHGWKFTTYTERNDGWTSTSDIPIPNIYEIAFKCKEWAFNKMYFLSSGLDTSGGWCLIRDINKSFVNEKNPYTEIEAIIKACEWILNNQGN